MSREKGRKMGDEGRTIRIVRGRTRNLRGHMFTTTRGQIWDYLLKVGVIVLPVTGRFDHVADEHA